MFARNHWRTGFGSRVAFADLGGRQLSWTGDRKEFLGRNGTLAAPAAMTRSRLSGRVGAALDPCAAIQIPFELADGQEREIVFTLGAEAKLHCLDLNTGELKWKHDLTADYSGIKVVVDPSSAQLLTGAVLDYKDGLQQAGFSINNPNAQRTCGCGQSFS